MTANNSRQAVATVGGRQQGDGGGRGPSLSHDITFSAGVQLHPALTYSETLRLNYQCSLGAVYEFLLSRCLPKDTQPGEPEQSASEDPSCQATS